MYEQERKTMERLFEEAKPIKKLFENANRELNKNKKENGIFLSIVKKLLYATEEMLSDFSSEKLENENFLNVFRSIAKYIKKNPGLVTSEMQEQFQKLRDKINNILNENDIVQEKTVDTISVEDSKEIKHEDEHDLSMNNLDGFEWSPPPLMIQCPVCEEKKELSMIKTFDCDHKICRDCA